MTTNSEVLKPDDATLILKRTLNATPERAFDVWISPEHIPQWMQPEPGASVTVARVDLRVGGKFRIQMKKSDGEYYTAVGEFREVNKPEKLVYTWDFEKDGAGTEFGETEGTPSLVTVEFLKRGDKTEFVLTHSRFAKIQSRDNHAEGWGTFSVRFAELAEKK